MPSFHVKAARRAGLIAAGLAWLAVPGPGWATGDATKGETLYEARCSGCHSIESNRVGPLHAGVVGRKAGGVPGFDDSPALRKAGFIWTPERLDQWLQGPPKMVPGTRTFFTVKAPADRADIIAYLASTSKP